MPGIITHYKTFTDAVRHLENDRLKDPYSKLILELFRNDFFKKAALFGTLGPNIFDYLPVKKSSRIYGSSISYYIHNEGFEKFLSCMIKDIMDYRDSNNENFPEN